MQNYQFIIKQNLQEDPNEYNFPTYLFNEPYHLISQNATLYYTFYLKNIKKQIFETRWSIFLAQDKALSPLRGTFGSIEFNSAIDIQALYYFLERVESFLKEKNIHSITIKDYPFCYANENSQLLTQVLHHLNYKISVTELNQHINLSEKNILNNFHTSAKRRLKKCQKSGFYFQENKNPDLEFTYNFVKEARIRKGYPISLTYNIFEHLFQQYPDKYKIFEVLDNNTVVALTVSVEINKSILYNFYPADNPAYLNFSPQILLYYEMINFAKSQSYEILDLGISTDQGNPNFGLLRFKKNIGSKISLKNVFFKVLNKVNE